MWQYIGKRVLLMIPTLLGTAIVVFLLMRVVPGDTALLIVGSDQGGEVNVHELERVRQQLGLDRPLHMQFLSWLWGITDAVLGLDALRWCATLC